MSVSVEAVDDSATRNEDFGILCRRRTRFRQSDFSRVDTGGGRQRYRATREFEVTVLEDIMDESIEQFKVVLSYSNPTLPHLKGSSAEATVTINDNDHVPVNLSWEQSSFTVDEDAGTVTLRAEVTTEVDKMPESGFDVVVSVEAVDDSATRNEDFSPLSTTYTFRQSDFSWVDTGGGRQRYRATREFEVTVLEDIMDESIEQFKVALSYSNPALPHLRGSSAEATVTINDNDHVPVNLSWEQSSFTVDEDAGTVTLRAEVTTEVDKMPESGFDVVVSVEAVDDSATRNEDFSPLSTTYTFRQSDFSRVDTGGGRQRYRATREFEVTVIEDIMDESIEQFKVVLSYSNPTLPHLKGSSAEATVTINDNDHVPVNLSWEQSSFTVDEDAGTVTLRAEVTTEVDKMPESGFDVVVSVEAVDDSATRNEDFSPLSTTYTLPAERLQLGRHGRRPAALPGNTRVRGDSPRRRSWMNRLNNLKWRCPTATRRCRTCGEAALRQPSPSTTTTTCRSRWAGRRRS